MEVKFAPLNVPFQRRLQALSVAFFITTFAFGNLLFVAFGVYVAFCTKYGLVLATLYAVWYYYDFETPWKGGHPGEELDMLIKHKSVSKVIANLVIHLERWEKWTGCAAWLPSGWRLKAAKYDFPVKASALLAAVQAEPIFWLPQSGIPGCLVGGVLWTLICLSGCAAWLPSGRRLKAATYDFPVKASALLAAVWRILRYFPLWKYYLAYFPIRLVKTAELPADKNYLIGVFPHGVISLGVIGNFSSIWSDSVKVFPEIDFHPITLDIHFKTPLFRDYILNIGAIPASKECIGNIVSKEKKGNACVLIVGGAAEAMYAKPGPYRILLNKRKGFVRLALVKGCSLVPAFSFGEIDIYDQITAEPGSKLYRFQMWVKNKTGIVPIIPKGRGLFQYSFGYMPHRSPITTVVGSPIEVPKILNPSEEDVSHYHELFKKKLEELFEENKIKYIKDPETARLIFE